MPERDIYDNISPLDYRYWDEEVAQYLSENGFTRYKFLVELALVRVLARRGLCSEEVVKEVEAACVQVTTAGVYEEEGRIRHDIRALVNCIRARVNDSAKPYIHMTATSYDIIDSANAARYRDAVEKVLVPALTKLEKVLTEIILREAERVQIGRTHGQHAVPITFGFAMAGYVSRLGSSIKALGQLAAELPGKFSGAVGAYNASSLFFDDPEGFEVELLAELGLVPAEHSTQIVPPEPMMRLLSEITLVAGVMANLARDMRHLQRTEIAEVGEGFETEQVGSSTMPQKRNPIDFENVESMWKLIVGRLVTVYLDQISEHQRDLTGSASSRTYGELVSYVVAIAKRLTRVMQKLTVDRANLERNLTMQKDLVLAEPLYIILAALGYPDAHEKVRQLTLKAQAEQRSLIKIAMGDSELQGYWNKMSPKQREILSEPSKYIGISSQKARQIAEKWARELEL